MKSSLSMLGKRRIQEMPDLTDYLSRLGNRTGFRSIGNVTTGNMNGGNFILGRGCATKLDRASIASVKRGLKRCEYAYLGAKYGESLTRTIHNRTM